MDSVWVVVLLTDGAANASEPHAASGTLNRYCPPSTWPAQPYCRDASATTRHSLLNTIKFNPNNTYDPGVYDADDYARDMADFVACPARVGDAAPWCEDSQNYALDEGGQEAVIFSVGLGRWVVANPYGDPDAGDQLLRYIAAVGDDSNPETDPCTAVPPPTLTGGNDSYTCGNYYFSEFGTGVAAVFENIAARIFTRLTR
jgi:hypothetical protein